MLQPTQKLDYELELAIYVGKSNQLGQPVSLSDAEQHNGRRLHHEPVKPRYKIVIGIHMEPISLKLSWGSFMYSKEQFAAFELMCRGRAEVAKKEMEYWLAEAEEWKQLSESPDPFIEGRADPASGCTESNYQ